MPDEESVEMQETVRELVALEAGPDYQKAREVIKERTSMRKTLKELAEQETKLPLESKYFVGIVVSRQGRRLKGRVSYRDLAEELAKRQGISNEELDKMKEDYRGEAGRIAYGLREKLGQDGRQLKFSFMTPE